MNKKEYIVELTKLLDPNADEFYTNGIVDAIRLAHKLDEHAPPVAGDLLKGVKNHLTTIEAIRRFFKVKISNTLNERIIATLINSHEVLAAVKTYKDLTGRGLKECKQEVDRVRLEIGFITKGEYESMWEKIPY